MSEQIGMTPNVAPVNEGPRYERVITESYRPKYAGFWIRFWAYLIDLLIVGSISGIVVKPIFRVMHIEITNPSFLLFSPYKIVSLVLLLVYFTLMTKWFQQTVGKMIMGIQVKSSTGQPLTWGHVIFREVFGRFISKTLLIPYLLVIFMPKKEALHDIFADTVVVHEKVYEQLQIQSFIKKEEEGHRLQDEPII